MGVSKKYDELLQSNKAKRKPKMNKSRGNVQATIGPTSQIRKMPKVDYDRVVTEVEATKFKGPYAFDPNSPPPRKMQSREQIRQNLRKKK